MRKRYKGKFKIKNPQKYKGNPTNIIYRSLMELRFMKWCDSSEKIIEWSSEEIAIPYVSPWDNQIHRYYPDFYLKVKKGRQEIVHIIEIKPKKQTVPPKKPKKKRSKRFLTESKTYVTNCSKWEAAKKYCQKRKWIFQILTEDHLYK